MSTTPGPWEVHDVAEVDEEWEEHHDFRYGIVNHRETAFIAQALESADACLIAAAPELLAALEHMNGHNHSTWTDEFQAQVDAVIAKATGAEVSA